MLVSSGTLVILDPDYLPDYLSVSYDYEHNQGLMLRFSCNDPNQRYYLNGMWTCGPSVLILFQ